MFKNQQGSERAAAVLRHHINSPLTIAEQVLLNDMPIPNGKAVKKINWVYLFVTFQFYLYNKLL